MSGLNSDWILFSAEYHRNNLHKYKVDLFIEHSSDQVSEDEER